MQVNHRITAPIALFFVPVLYGGFYISTIMAMAELPVFWLGTFRMGIALIFFLPFAGKLRGMNRTDGIVNIILGTIIFGGLIAQSYGLQTVSAGMGGFLAALFIIFTPILRRLIFRMKMSSWFIIPIGLSLFGYYWLFKPADGSALKIGLGEWLSIIGALSIALHMVVMEKFVEGRDPFVYANLQTGVVFMESLIFACLFEFRSIPQEISISTWGFIAYLGIGATLFTFLLQSYGQQYVNAVLASIIIALEPIFATLFGIWIGGENISLNFIKGGSLVLWAAILAVLFQLKTMDKNKREFN
jgi:drug/metabolite transporter (DMT)-like permease